MSEADKDSSPCVDMDDQIHENSNSPMSPAASVDSSIIEKESLHKEDLVGRMRCMSEEITKLTTRSAELVVNYYFTR